MSIGSIPAPRIETQDTTSEARPDKFDADLLDHQYDGIQEYDNPLPRWWVLIFWASFVFSIFYFFHYHVSHNGASVEAAYASEMEEARRIEAKQALGEKVSQESLEKLAVDVTSMAEAKALFGARCAPCHADRGQGLIGPNLTDAYWVHGDGQLMAIYGVVNEGVLAKGMPAWGKQLSPAELRKLVAYVGTLSREPIPGKAPEGTKVE